MSRILFDTSKEKTCAPRRDDLSEKLPHSLGNKIAGIFQREVAGVN